MIEKFDPVLLSRIQFAFSISFHIIFPAFTIGLVFGGDALWMESRESKNAKAHWRLNEIWQSALKQIILLRKEVDDENTRFGGQGTPF